MNGEEALEYLSAADVLHIRRPGDDARCDEAVATFCKEYRYAGAVPRFYTNEPARRACSVLLMYAAQYLSQAALASQTALLDKGMVAMDVAEAATLDPHEVGRILDRFIVLIGTINAEPRLLTAAARMEVSDELKALIKSRIAKNSA